MAQNLLTDNQADIETDTTGLAAQAGATITRVVTELRHGEASLRTVTDNLTANEGFRAGSVDVSASQTYTASVWLMGAAGTVKVFISERNAADGNIATDGGVTVTLNGTWVRTSITRAFGALGVKARISVQTPTQQGITFYADCLQVEQSDGVTPWRLPSGWGRRNAGRDLVVL